MSADTLRPLIELIQRLRGPDGCPWDREQELPDVRAYLVEEAHEVAAAIDQNDLDELAGELGDLLFQVVFTAELLREADGPTLDGIVERIRTKMIDRHPHVFGDESLASIEEVHRAWETRKAMAKPAGGSLLDGVPASLPALLAAYRMTQKASGVGFDWPNVEGVLAKVEEELGEVREALDRADELPGEATEAQVGEEVGDLLFAVANLGRHVGADPEAALAATNLKFRRRFAHIERTLEAEGRPLGSATLEELNRHWNDAKALEAEHTE